MSQEPTELPADEPKPLVELLRLAGPTIAQMASYTVMQFLDTWMLSHVGDGIIAATAATNSGILAFSVISFGVGVLWVVNTMVSQSFGRREFTECGRYMWQGIWFSVIFSLAVLPTIPLAPAGFASLGHEPELARQEAVYLQILVAGAVLKLVATAASQFLIAIDRAHCVMIATVTGVLVNALAAWAMIFGKLGLPQMGIVGAAWAQNIGVGLEMLLAVGFAMTPWVRRTYNSLDFPLRMTEMKALLRVGVPSGVQVVVDVLAWGIWGNLVMSFFGTKGMAANNYVFRYMSVSFMPAFGLSTAVTALVGRYIGRGRPDIAVQRAHLGFVVALVYMLGCGAMFIIARHRLIGLFSVDPEVLRIGGVLLIFAAMYQLFDAVFIVYYGALRGAGDTFVPAVATAVLCWSITVGGGYAVARFVPQLGPKGPWIAASVYGAILSTFIYLRFIRGGWRSINLDAPGESDTVPNLKLATEP